ncbi:MAG: hypothetical protein VKM92_01945 [Cyanobacteriota bacterium]|nr:hypothetical protein [Cyanobacteriota bacterium]
MPAHDLGKRLRRQLLAAQQRGQRPEPVRLQALVNDLCGDDLGQLRPALHALTLSHAFHQAINRNPPLPADPALLSQLQGELNAVFTAEIGAGMTGVLQGLLALPEAELQADPPAAARTPAGRGSGARPSAIVLLGAMACALMVGLGGMLVWLSQLQRPRIVETPTLPQPPPLAAEPEAAPALAAEPVIPPVEESDELSQRAIASVEQLYAALSAGNRAEAERLFTAAAADQFTASFFQQFERVEVGELVETERQGDLVILMGHTRFVYRDGSSQDERRLFQVDTSVEPPLIVASRFEEVLRARQ